MEEDNKQPDGQDTYDLSEQSVDAVTLPAEPIESPEQANEAATPTEPTEPVDEVSTAPAASEAEVLQTEVIEPITAAPDTSVEPNEEAQSVSPAPATTTPAPKSSISKQKIIIVAVAILLAVSVAVVTWLALAANTSPTKDSTVETTQQQPRLGIAVTVVDGVVEYQLADDATGTWQPLAATTELGEGDTVRTDIDGRAVLTFDDGSAVRLDANTSVKLTSLVASDIKITQQTGAVYSRVVTSERKYAVTVNGTAYEALGTAFTTINKPDASGVQVYQSSVKAGGQTIAEGKQYYVANPDSSVQGKVTDIDLDKLTDDAFVAWNLAEDEKDANFKAKLGVLADVKQKSQAKADEAARLEQERKAQAELAARAKAERDKEAQEEADKKKKQSRNTSKEKVTRGTMSLTRSSETFSWSYTGKAVHGYKLVWSKSDSNPRFGSSHAVYFGDINQTSGSLSLKSKEGKGTFYVAVCAYTAGTEADGCVDYSNVIKYTRN